MAVTYAPGLIGAVLVGVNFAKAAALALNKPPDPGPPHPGTYCRQLSGIPGVGAALPVSHRLRGHTMIVDVKDYTEMEILGTTLDDAAGGVLR